MVLWIPLLLPEPQAMLVVCSGLHSCFHSFWFPRAGMQSILWKRLITHWRDVSLKTRNHNYDHSGWHSFLVGLFRKEWHFADRLLSIYWFLEKRTKRNWCGDSKSFIFSLSLSFLTMKNDFVRTQFSNGFDELIFLSSLVIYAIFIVLRKNTSMFTFSLLVFVQVSPFFPPSLTPPPTPFQSYYLYVVTDHYFCFPFGELKLLLALCLLMLSVSY